MALIDHKVYGALISPVLAPAAVSKASDTHQPSINKFASAYLDAIQRARRSYVPRNLLRLRRKLCLHVQSTRGLARFICLWPTMMKALRIALDVEQYNLGWCAKENCIPHAELMYEV